MAYISQGNLRFLTRHVDKQEWKKPSKNILTVSIKLENVIQSLSEALKLTAFYFTYIFETYCKLKLFVCLLIFLNDNGISFVMQVSAWNSQIELYQMLGQRSRSLQLDVVFEWVFMDFELDWR